MGTLTSALAKGSEFETLSVIHTEFNHSILYLVTLSKSPMEAVVAIGSTLSPLCQDRLLQYNRSTLEGKI